MLTIQYARHLSGVFLFCLVSACATPPQTLDIRNNPPASIASNIELSDVPFFPQQEYQCGPSSLATILNHQGIQISPDQLADRVYIPDKEGSLQIEMIATARNFGLLAYKLRPSITNILAEIDHGNAVLVFQNLALKAWPKWHYAVAVGYDLRQAELILRSGTYERHRISFSTFEQTWHRANYWAYVFTKAGDIPHTANTVEYIKACYDLQKSTDIEHALAAFRSGGNRWPEDSLMLMTLANVEYTIGNWQRAIEHLQNELGMRPQNATAWNNLAYALVASGCQQPAISAAQCALRLSPDNQNFRHSLLELKQLKKATKGRCQTIQCPLTDSSLNP